MDRRSDTSATGCVLPSLRKERTALALSFSSNGFNDLAPQFAQAVTRTRIKSGLTSDLWIRAPVSENVSYPAVAFSDRIFWMRVDRDPVIAVAATFFVVLQTAEMFAHPIIRIWIFFE